MYGFIEKWLADIIGVSYEPFFLNNGLAAALLSEEDFTNVYFAIFSVWLQDCPEGFHNNRALDPATISSDIVGTKVLFHVYWNNEEILYGLTDGPIKETGRFRAFANLTSPKFAFDTFPSRIREAYNVRIGVFVPEVSVPINIYDVSVSSRCDTSNSTVQTPGMDPETLRDALVVLQECATEPIVVPDELISKNEEGYYSLSKIINSSIGYINLTRISPMNNNRVNFIYDTTPSDGIVNSVIELSDVIDKNIFFFLNGIKTSIFSSLNKEMKLSDIAKHSIFIFSKPEFYPALSFCLTEMSRNRKPSCLGEVISDVYCVIPTQTSEDGDVDAYSKYDEIFKDTATNIVWALRDRCLLYFTFPYNVFNYSAFLKCIDELKKRFGRKLQLDEIRAIDKEYLNKVSEKNMENYIGFSVSSARLFLDEIKSKFEEQKLLYVEYVQKAMEYGKLVQQLSCQIEYFNEGKMSEDRKKKAMDDYSETIKIPGVLSISIDDGIVNVYTKNLYAQDDRTKKWHDIGTFHISIGMLSSDYNTSNTVKVMNTKHQISGLYSHMQAPHIFSNGIICHGSLSGIMIEAYKRRDLFEIIYQLILFLQDANTDDSAGKYISNWPEVSEETAKNWLLEDEGAETPDPEESKFDNELLQSIPTYVN